jgi:serine/threonine-protein kinase
MPILTAEERVGTLLAGKYRLERILGRGGMGVVYAATHTWTDRPVAVKLLHHDPGRDASIEQRFLQEARSAATLRHPNVVDVLDMGQAEHEGVYLVLEMLDGESLADRLQRGPLTPTDALAYLLPVMDALEAAHAKGTIHRDMKPDNIFLSRNGAGQIVPKVLDFGIAKRVDPMAAGVKTVTGQLLGTPFYMSPEQTRGAADLGAQSDVWSMGVVWFECLSARLPFHAESLGELIFKLVTEAPPPLASVVPDVNAGLAAAIGDAMLIDRAKRHASMKVFSERLRSAADEAGLMAPAQSAAIVAGDATTPSVPPPSNNSKPAPRASTPPAKPDAIAVESVAAVTRNPMPADADRGGGTGAGPARRGWIVGGAAVVSVVAVSAIALGRLGGS